MGFRRWLHVALGAGVFLAGGGRALAQTPGNVANEEAGYLVWVVCAGAGLIICATGFMNSKRSHLN